MTSPVPGADALRQMTANLDDAAVPAPSEVTPRAATVVVTRDRGGAVEILMLRRPERGSFAGAWVFPGGKVEPQDADGASAPIDVLRNAAVRETHEEVGLSIRPNELVCLSNWEPPAQLAVRIRTWFFLATSFTGDLVPQPSEVEETLWITPDDMVARHAAGEVTLYPPTFVTLVALAGAAGGDDLIARFGSAEPREYRTNLRKNADGIPTFRWQGDYEYDEDMPGQSGVLHRVVAGDVPWRYLREISD